MVKKKSKNKNRNLKPLAIKMRFFNIAPAKPIKNNFIKSTHQFKTGYGYRVVVECKHRYFEIMAETGSSTGIVEFNGLMIEYVGDPHAQWNTEVKGCMVDFVVQRPEGEYSLVWSKNKEILELYFVKDLYSTECYIKRTEYRLSKSESKKPRKRA